MKELILNIIIILLGFGFTVYLTTAIIACVNIMILNNKFWKILMRSTIILMIVVFALLMYWITL